MEISQIKDKALNQLQKTGSLSELEKFRIKYLGRKGELTAVLRSLKDLPINKRKKTGQAANKFKIQLEKAIEQKKKKLRTATSKTEGPKIDITAPGIKFSQGHLHPLTQAMNQIEEIFQSMGFKVVEGPDIESEYNNFDALNIPKDHPARDAWDTFWLKNKKLLRTHTSPMQVRYMKKNTPPFRIIVPGRVFRYENIDASHSHTFYQLEGLMVDKDISVANFKAIMEDFLEKLFGKDIKTRIRPSHFPFTEPSLEIDIYKDKKWLEIVGAGIVHPNVFKAVGYNPVNWQGFAFGMGIDRIAMKKYGINDIRLFYSGDLRFLNQF